MIASHVVGFYRLSSYAKNIKEEPELSKETIESINKARERMKKGQFVTEEEAKKRMGL